MALSNKFFRYSRRAKALLESYQIRPAPFVVEIDTRTDGPIIQKLLGRITGRSTVPNVLVRVCHTYFTLIVKHSNPFYYAILQSQSIGGSDDIHSLHDENKLKDILLESGLEVHGL